MLKKLDDVVTIKDQVIDDGLLAQVAIYEGAKHEVMRINFVGCDNCGAIWIVGVPGLATW